MLLKTRYKRFLVRQIRFFDWMNEPIIVKRKVIIQVIAVAMGFILGLLL